jgi:8-oxo-dGTP pyrophosphatase MutT (NUDIX family)
MAETAPRTPATPVLAATVLILRDDPFEVLMVRRTRGDVFGSALVFPGGKVDPDDAADHWLPLVEDAGDLPVDERALRIAALRETFEEAALLVAHDVDGRCVAPADRDANGVFRQVVAASGGKLRLGDLVPFGHWITPAESPKRFDTHFFLCRAAEGQEAICDGGETVALEWAAPADLLARAAAGERSILFPTRMNLKRLAESASVDAAFAAARARTPYTVCPVVIFEDGKAFAEIPLDAGYGETRDTRDRTATAAHRSG